MKIIPLLVFVFIVSNVHSQIKRLESVSISYYGEIITHPGLKINTDFNVKNWDKVRNTKKNSEKTVNKSLIISPSLGVYYHKRYQTGLFLMPELKYKRLNPKGMFYEFGIGAGYLRTLIPNTYEVSENGVVEKVPAGNNYFSTNYFIAFGKDLKINKNLPLAYFIKPQFMFAVPNFPGGTSYFALELGICYKLKQ